LFQVRARGRDRVRQLGFVALKSARSLLRLGKLLLTLRAVAVQFARSLFERGKFAMQAVVADAQLRKRAAQFAVFDALLVKLADCCVDRFGQAAEGLLNVAYRADSMPGVDQQIAQLLVVLAKTGADVGESQFASVLGNGPIRIGGSRRRGLPRGRGLARTKTGKHPDVPKPCHTSPLMLYSFLLRVTGDTAARSANRAMARRQRPPRRVRPGPCAAAAC
jgi:hypothetical protein